MIQKDFFKTAPLEQFCGTEVGKTVPVILPNMRYEESVKKCIGLSGFIRIPMTYEEVTKEIDLFANHSGRIIISFI